MNKQQTSVWLDAKADEYCRQHEFALASLSDEVLAWLIEDVGRQ